MAGYECSSVRGYTVDGMPQPNSATSSAPSSTLAPFALRPVLVERIWGTTDLKPWHDAAVSGGPVGEIWLTAENCEAAAGAEAGKTLKELTAASPEALGDRAHEGFPLLIKLLFPREKLSVQVHPNDEQAQALGMPRGKTECWYVLSAEAGAQVAVGFNEPLSTDEVKAAIADGSLESKLRMIPVKAGDMVFVDAGTVHAIGPGMVVLETQQYSDTTYRLWDYGRPRELHVDAGTAVTRTSTAAGLVEPEVMDGFTRLVTSAYFAVDRFDLSAGATQSLAAASHLQILISLAEDVVLTAGEQAPIALPRAQAVVVPAGESVWQLESRSSAAVIRVLQP